jgi:hypothetical protein
MRAAPRECCIAYNAWACLVEVERRCGNGVRIKCRTVQVERSTADTSTFQRYPQRLLPFRIFEKDYEVCLLRRGSVTWLPAMRDTLAICSGRE